MTNDKEKLYKDLAQRRVKRHLDTVAGRLGYRLVSAPVDAEQLRQKEFLTVKEFAWLFNVSERHVLSEAQRGRVYFTKNGKLTRIHRDEIARYSRYLEKRTTEAKR